MAWPLRAQAVLLEDLGSIPAHTWQLTAVYNSSLRGSDPFFGFREHQAWLWHTDTHTDKMFLRLFDVYFTHVRILVVYSRIYRGWLQHFNYFISSTVMFVKQQFSSIYLQQFFPPPICVSVCLCMPDQHLMFSTNTVYLNFLRPDFSLT